MPKEKYDPPDPRRCYTIMSAEEASSGKKSHWAELEISGRVRSLSSSLWTLTHLTALHINDNNLTRIPPDIAKLPNLVYLNLSSNKLRSLPAELGNMVSLRELLLNNNLLRVLPYELGRLFQLQTLGLKGNPLSQDILNLYQELDGTRKLLNYMLDNLAVHPEQLPQRPWITLKERDQMMPTATFTVMCYNVLCDKYATRQLYGYCPSWALNWEYRKKGIMEEITSCDADIISLQEVETEQYYTMFLETLKERGYDGYFCPKSRAKLVSEQKGLFKEVQVRLGEAGLRSEPQQQRTSGVPVGEEGEAEAYICDVAATSYYQGDDDYFNNGYIRVDEDTNKGASGGAYVFIWYRQTTKPEEAIRDLQVSTNDAEYQRFQSQYKPVNMDLNQGTAGSPVFLWYQKDGGGGGGPIKDVTLVVTREDVGPFEAVGAEVINKNLNAGNSGAPELFLCFYR